MSSFRLSQTVADMRKHGGIWRVVVAVPGEGARGLKFSKELLQSEGPKAFPAGTKAYIVHKPVEERDPRDQFGSYPKGVWYDENFDLEKYPEGALVADLQVKKRFAEIIDDLGEDGELSIFADGDFDSDGTVLTIEQSRANTIDLVGTAGLEGARLYEKISQSLDSAGDKTGDHSAQDKETKDKMEQELKDLIALVKTLQDTVTSLATAKADELTAEQKAEAEAKVAAEVEAKVEDVLGKYDDDVKLIDAADLLPALAESLKADARKGNLAQSAIDYAKKVTDEAKSLAQSGGFQPRVTEEDKNSKSDDFTIGRWNA